MEREEYVYTVSDFVCHVMFVVLVFWFGSCV
jgi:hypothetical protein